MCETPGALGVDGECYSYEDEPANPPEGLMPDNEDNGDGDGDGGGDGDGESGANRRRRKRSISGTPDLHSGAPYLLASRRCQDLGGHLLHVGSDAELDSLTEVLMHMSEFTSVDTEILVGLYHDPYAAFTTLDSGQKM